MHKILCPIDFSDASLNALEFAVALGEKEHSELTLLNIFTPADFNKIVASEDVKEKYEELMLLAESKLKAISNEIGNLSLKKGLSRCTYRLLSGTIVDVISDLAQAEKYDLVVMGTTGHSSYDKKYLGGKAQDIIANTTCPVICIPQDYSFHKIDKMVYATDYQEEDKIAIQHLSSLAQKLDASIQVLHVSHHDHTIDKAIFEEFKNELEHFIDSESIIIERVVFKHVASGLDEFMKETNSDVLVLLDKKRNFLKSIFHTSLTEHLDKFAGYPLMILKL